MSDLTERRSPTEQPLYIVWILMFVVAFTVAQLLVSFGIYYLIYGMPTVSEWMTIQTPDYSHSALWKDRVWYSVMKIGPNNPPGKATLKSIDPEKGDVTESKVTVPFPITGFLPQGDRLWVVTSASVTLVEGDQSTEYKPTRLIGQSCEPFLFEDRLAVLDSGKNLPPSLLVFENGQWVDHGEIVVPSTLSVEQGQLRAAVARLPNGYVLPQEVKVVTHNGQIHVFVSDGVHVGYQSGFVMAVTSALTPANVPDELALAGGSLEGGTAPYWLPNWELVCPVSAKVGPRGKNSWNACFVDSQPVVVAISSTSTSPSPFNGNMLQTYLRVDGVWQKKSETKLPATLELLVASDGQKTFIAGQSVVQTLRFFKVATTETSPTGVVLKAPVLAFQPAMERWLKIYPWVFWPGLFFFALGVSQLMKWYLNPAYQFGNTTVELASFTRRGIARVIDYFIFGLPSYALSVAFGLSNQEQVEKDMDKIFDNGGLMIQLGGMMFGMLLLALLILIINSWLQGRWGVTLGKWICGIRTVRATLRPCGFLRAMLREIFLVVDMLFGMTIVPGTLAIAFTTCRQRIGDLLADTIVIRRPVKSTETAITHQ